MYKKLVGHALLLILVGTSFILKAQVTQSPFTSRGLGDILEPGLAHNQAIGGLGISNGSYLHYNSVNPALLTYNSLTVFAAGVELGNRTIDNGIDSEESGAGGLKYLALAFPVKPGRWTTSIGLRPYSHVDYSFSQPATVQNSGDSAVITESGEGGLNQVYWSNGVALNQNISIGLKASYMFSQVESSYIGQVFNVENIGIYPTAINSRTSVSDFMFQLGASYRKDSIFNNRIQLKLGATYDFGTDLKSKTYRNIQLLQGSIPITNDTTSYDGGQTTIPQAFGVGFSFNNGIKWMAGIDIKYQQWSDYKDVDGNNEQLDDSYKIIIGGEFTPDPGSVESYFKRVTLRAGLYYENTPYVINGSQVNDFGINFGWSLPVGRASNLDMAFTYGQRGNVDDTLLEEKYYRFTLGITFNDQWFIKRKYD